MDISAVIRVLKVVVAELPDAVKTGEQLVDLGVKSYEAANGHVPSIAEVAELRAAIDADVAIALTPLPPAQKGDPDFVEPQPGEAGYVKPVVETPPIAPSAPAGKPA